MTHDWQEKLVDKKVTYTLELDGEFFLVENVPARVNEETGEQFFSPSTVEQLQKLILEGEKPHRIVEAAVYSFV